MKPNRTPIPIVGLGLAGKTTILKILSSIYSSELCFTSIIIEEGPLAGHPTSVVYVDIEGDSRIYRAQAAPGGPGQEAILMILRGAEKGVFVFDPQAPRKKEEMNLWKTVEGRIPKDGWFFVINKMDLIHLEWIEDERLDTEEGAKEYLRDRGTFDDRPFISISAIDDSARSHVKGLFREIIS